MSKHVNASSSHARTWCNVVRDTVPPPSSIYATSVSKKAVKFAQCVYCDEPNCKIAKLMVPIYEVFYFTGDDIVDLFLEVDEIRTIHKICNDGDIEMWLNGVLFAKLEDPLNLKQNDGKKSVRYFFKDPENVIISNGLSKQIADSIVKLSQLISTKKIDIKSEWWDKHDILLDMPT